jgi:hypothetical protein
MMKTKMVLCLSALVAFASASSAFACDKKCGTAKTKALTTAVKTDDAKATVSAKKSGCCSKGKAAAQTVAVKTDDAKATVSAKKSGCGSKGKAAAQTVAVKTDDAKATVSAKKSGCCSKGKAAAQTVAVKTDDAKQGKSPCSSKRKGATTVSDTKSGCPKKCNGKAKLTAQKSNCHKSAGKAVLTSAGGCPKAKAKAILASMPGMTYRVGDIETGCSKTATAKSESASQPIQYLVDGNAYKTELDATLALTKILDDRAKEMTEVQFVAAGEVHKCPVTARKVASKAGGKMVYRVGGIDFDSEEKAKAAAESARSALTTVKLTYLADGEAVGCHKSAKASGKAITFNADGEKTKCEKAAALIMAQHRYRAVVETVASL